MKTSEEKRKMSKGETPMHLKVTQMSHLILQRDFPLNCYGNGSEYFEYPEGYYIDEAKTIVSFQKNAKPFDETSLPSEAPAKYVLEIYGGLSDEWQLTVGDRIAFDVLK